MCGGGTAGVAVVVGRGPLDHEAGVEGGLIDSDLSTVRNVGMDEKIFLRGQSYATTLCDLGKVRVIEVVEGRKEQDARAAIASLPEAVRAGVKAIAMDIWPAFINAAGKDLLGADVVFDRFHVSRHMGDAVDEVRRMEHKV